MIIEFKKERFFKMNITINLYDKIKYEDGAKVQYRVQYSNVIKIELVTGKRATKIGEFTDEYSRDPFNEYLVCTFKNGEESTFRNSYVNLSSN